MIECNKRQTVVKRSKEGTSTIFRCLNKQSGLQGQEVDECVCSRCPVRSVEHKRPCKKKPASLKPVTVEEFNNVSNEELLAMVEEAGLDPEELTSLPVAPSDPSQPPPSYPPLTIQLWTYKEAILRWAKAGRPVRSQEEVKRIHREHCEPCEWYDKDNARCKGCGCFVSVSSIAISNKLKMATEHCPKGKF